jgi:hypothetical protein
MSGKVDDARRPASGHFCVAADDIATTSFRPAQLSWWGE